MWPFAVLEGFSKKNVYGRFAGTKISGQKRGDRIVNRKTELNCTELNSNILPAKFVLP